MSSKINLQTCEYARKSSIFQDNQLIFNKYNSEKVAVQHLRQFILSVDTQELTRFADIFEYVKEKMREVEKEAFSLENQREELTAMYRKQKWFCTGIPFTVDDIMQEMSREYHRVKQAF